MKLAETVSKNLNKWRKNTTSRTKKTLIWVENRAKRAPLLVLILLLALLLGIIALGNQLRTPEPQPKADTQPTLPVSVYTIGESPRVTVNAQVEKTGVITIVAPAPGVVNTIKVEPGQNVYARQTVVNLSSNYSGGNVPALQAQIAKKQLENLEQTLPLQKDAIAKQREIAKSSETNNEELREISRASLADTRGLLDLNEEILDSLDDIISTSTDSAQILQTKQLKAQVLSGVVQLRSQLRQTEYQSSEDNPPADLGRLQRDLTLKQLEIQEKSLDLNKEVTELQLKIARVQAANMFPAAPFAGRIERIHVRKGQYVQPGTPLVTMDCDLLATQVIAKIPAGIAHQVSSYELSRIVLGDKELWLQPDYVSHEATDGQLYTAVFTIPQESAELLTDKAYVSVELPLGMASTSAVVPSIPLDAVHQNEQGAMVYLMVDRKAVTRQLELGSVQGRYVAVESGLQSGDQVILDRKVVAGQPVSLRDQVASEE